MDFLTGNALAMQVAPWAINQPLGILLYEYVAWVERVKFAQVN